MANPKSPFPKSIIDPRKRKLAHYNQHICNKINREAEIRLQEEKRETYLNRSIKYEKNPATMANPKLLPRLLRLLPKSILDPRNRKLEKYNCHNLKKKTSWGGLRLQENNREMYFPFKQVQKIWGKRQWTPNYYPNYYGRSQSQLSTSRSECCCIRTAISSLKEIASWSSAYNKIRGKQFPIQTGQENMEKCQRTPNYYPNCYDHSWSQFSAPRSKSWCIIIAISSRK